MAPQLEKRTQNDGQPVIVKNEAGNTVFSLKKGGKHLIVELTPHGQAKSYLDSTSEVDPKTSGATTELYTQARDWLQDQATQSGQPITYEMETGFSTMKKWMMNAGKKIFGWESVNPTVDDSEKLVASVTIPPRPTR